MFSQKYSDNTVSFALIIGAAVWGLYWFPLRAIEGMGLSGSWSVVFINACPLIVLCPLFIFNYKKLLGNFQKTILASIMIGFAFSFYAYALLESSIIRATLLFYLSPLWATAIGVMWLNERITKARILSICIGLVGLFLLLSQNDSINKPLNIGDLFAVLSGVFWAIGGSLLKKYPNISIIPLTTFLYIATTFISVIFAALFYMDPLPDIMVIKIALSTAIIWSVFILAPGFILVFMASKILYPGRVSILMMSEVIVAIISASILVPGETMVLIQWLGAIGIISAGLVEVFYGNKSL